MPLGRRFQPAAALAFTRPYWTVRTITERDRSEVSNRAFRFDIGERLRPWSRLFFVHPEAWSARIEHGQLSVLFGRWSLPTPVSNIADVTVTGPYTWWKVAGPAHLSIADRGVTFATTDERGVCISLLVPVAGIEPSGVVIHPNLTATVADVDGPSMPRTRPGRTPPARL